MDVFCVFCCFKAVIAAVQVLEDDPVFDAGTGSVCKNIMLL